MNRDDVIDVLTAVTAGDSRRDFTDDDITFWYEIIGDLRRDHALQAVKSHYRDRPGVFLEPGHVATGARAIHRDLLDRDPDYHRQSASTSDEDEADRFYQGDLKAAPEPPPYPHEWDSDVRVSVYWHALRRRIQPTTTKGWWAVKKDMENIQEKVNKRRAQEAEN